jgi:hypothetical protein
MVEPSDDAIRMALYRYFAAHEPDPWFFTRKLTAYRRANYGDWIATDRPRGKGRVVASAGAGVSESNRELARRLKLIK